MLSANNVLSPAHGRPLVTRPRTWSSASTTSPSRSRAPRARAACSGPPTKSSAPTRTATSTCTRSIEFRAGSASSTTPANGTAATVRRRRPPRVACSSTGRCPRTTSFINQRSTSDVHGPIVEDFADNYHKAVVAESLDQIKRLCFRYATQSGLTISIYDVRTPDAKAGILAASDDEAAKVESQFRRGIITDGERRQKEVEIWTRPTDDVREAMEPPQGQEVQPHRHDGRLGCPREHEAGPPARRHAWPHGQPPGRHHPPPDQVELP